MKTDRIFWKNCTFKCEYVYIDRSPRTPGFGIEIYFPGLCGLLRNKGIITEDHHERTWKRQLLTSIKIFSLGFVLSCTQSGLDCG